MDYVFDADDYGSAPIPQHLALLILGVATPGDLRDLIARGVLAPPINPDPTAPQSFALADVLDAQERLQELRERTPPGPTPAFAEWLQKDAQEAPERVDRSPASRVNEAALVSVAMMWRRLRVTGEVGEALIAARVLPQPIRLRPNGSRYFPTFDLPRWAR